MVLDPFVDDARVSQIRRLIAQFRSNIMEILEALANEARIQILLLLLDHAVTFTDFETIIPLKKTALAHHLKVLVDSRLIEKPARGVYRISEDGLQLLGALTQTYYFSNICKTESLRLHSIAIQNQLSVSEKTMVNHKMQSIEVNIITLPPMAVLSARAVGKEPEPLAWAKLERYVRPLGLLEDPARHPIFGFNNPDPIPGQSEYGYEFWIKVDSSIKGNEELSVKSFPGGLYAVKRCNISKECVSPFLKDHGLLESWFLLHKWVKTSQYSPGNHQWLEKVITPPSATEEVIADLYHPIVRKEI